MTRSVLTAVLLSLAGCATAPDTRSDSAGTGGTTGSASAATGAPAEAPLAALFRGPCLGKCPEYQVEVYPSGEVRFRGIRNVAVVGEARAQLDPAQLAKVSELFEAAHFDGFAGRYENIDTTDMPLVIIAYRGRLVRHAHGDSGAPPELTRLEDALDEALGTGPWVTGAVDR